MPCPHCFAYIEDILTYPSPDTQCVVSPILLQKYKGQLAYEFHHLLERVRNHHNMVKRVKREYCNLIEKKIHTPTKPLEIHLFDVSYHFYDYMYPSKQKQEDFRRTIEYLCCELISLGIVRSTQRKDPMIYPKIWLLQKYFHFVEHLDMIHEEHTTKSLIGELKPLYNGIIRLEVIPEDEIQTWDELYN